MKPLDAEAEFALHMQRRLFALLGLSWDQISGVMLSKDIDTHQIHLEIVKFGNPTKHYIITSYEEE
jgi:hypothetical protein